MKGHTPHPKQQHGDDGCFIATACYGSFECEEVIVFRKFRDEVLLKFLWGKLFVYIYYLLSPTISKFVIKRRLVKNFIKSYLLNPVFKRIKQTH